MTDAAKWFLAELTRDARIVADATIECDGEGALPSAFAVTDFAAASIGAAAAAVARLASVLGATTPHVVVDRTLASGWFGLSLTPAGWELPPVWDAIAGDYETADGWIRLHTNAPHHRAAALNVLGCADRRDAVADAVRQYRSETLETSVVDAGGCAAALRSAADWAQHPQGRAVGAEPIAHREVLGAGGPVTWGGDPRRPLAGVRVLDLTRVLAGPVATRFLAAFGADVLRIDPPWWNEPSIEPEVTIGKRCGRLDLAGAEERGVLRGLLAQADVVVHGYRPGALAGLGLSSDECDALRPGLVDVALDAYGWTGPWAERRGFDSLVQMSTGIARAGQERLGAERPVPLPVQALDHATGYLLAMLALEGLLQRAETGNGLRARTSLARLAALLQSGPAGSFTPEPLTPAVREPVAEQTPWGPATRLAPPVDITGLAMGWDRVAGPLGSEPAPLRWLSRPTRRAAP